jgi:UPF0716 protein FxsA
VLESVGIYYVWQTIGAWTLLWLLLDMFLGASLLFHVQAGWAMQLMALMQTGATPWAALSRSGLRLFAGILLIVPGPISDVMAVLLLIASIVWRPVSVASASSPAFDGSIEGEFRRVDDPVLPSR